MDPSYFGLEGHPFGNSPEREPGFLAETHSSLVTELKAGLKAPHGITLLIGEEGTGKTTLIRRFADDLAEDCTVAYLPTTGPGLRHLLTETIEQLGGSPPPAGDEQALLDCLASLAHARAQHGRTTLVVVDDAHELPAKTIERVGRLFGDDPADPSMLHVVLVGRPELLDRMNAANDRTILKHLVQVCRMDPIGPEESFRYIADRIAKVGGVVDKLFTEDALRLIVKRANGNPGRIHALCSAAMSQAAESGEEAIAADTVDLACVGFDGFGIDAQQSKRAEKGDPMQYIFGEDDVDEASSQKQQHRTRAQVNGNKDHSSRENDPAQIKRTPAAAGPVERLRELLSGFGEGRRRLGLWAAGLVAVLVGFAAVMTATDNGTQPPVPAGQAEKIATAEPSSAAARTGGEADPLPSTAVRTSRLVVKRDGASEQSATGSQPPPPGTVAAGDASAVAVAPAPSAAEAKPESKPVQAPPYTATPQVDAASATPRAAPAGDTSLSAAAATAAAGSGVTDPAAPASSAASSATAKSSSATPAAATASDNKPVPVEVAAKSAPKPAAAVVTAKAAAIQTPTSQPTSSAGSKFTVQVGAFKSRDNAEALLDQIRKSYPDGRIVVTESGPASVYRVFSGAFSSRGDADSRARTLTENGFTTFVRDIPR